MTSITGRLVWLRKAVSEISVKKWKEGWDKTPNTSVPTKRSDQLWLGKCFIGKSSRNQSASAEKKYVYRDTDVYRHLMQNSYNHVQGHLIYLIHTFWQGWTLHSATANKVSKRMSNISWTQNETNKDLTLQDLLHFRNTINIFNWGI